MSLCHYVKFRYLKNTSQKLTAELELSIIKNIFLQRVCRVYARFSLKNITILLPTFIKLDEDLDG